MPEATTADFKKHHAARQAAAASAKLTKRQRKLAERAKNKRAALQRKAKTAADARIFDLTRKPAPTPKDDGPNPFK